MNKDKDIFDRETVIISAINVVLGVTTIPLFFGILLYNCFFHGECVHM